MKEELTKQEMKQILLNQSDENWLEQLEFIHPADILDIIHEEDEKTTQAILEKLPDSVIADIIDEEEDEEKYDLLKKFSKTKQKGILDEMSSDELTDLIGSIEDDKDANAVLTNMSEESRADVKKLLSYDPETAGGIMATEFISIYDTKTVKKTLEYLQKEAPGAETAYYLYVVDREGYLKGVLSLRDIVTASFDTQISEITNPNVITVRYDVDQEDVAHQFEKYGFLMMPVVDEHNKMLGIVTVDDIIEVIKEESTEDIYHLAGVTKEEKIDGTLLESIKSRLPWLTVNLFTALLAASVVGLFEGTISKVVSLATIMPIVTGMGGNAGTQSLTIIVRGLALDDLDKENAKKIFLKELGVGLVSGLTIGCAISILGMLFEGNVMFGVVTGVAMFLNIVMATIAGYMVPIILKKLGVDPALASAVFVTTVTDILGFFFFLGLSTVFLSYLM